MRSEAKGRQRRVYKWKVGSRGEVGWEFSSSALPEPLTAAEIQDE